MPDSTTPPTSDKWFILEGGQPTQVEHISVLFARIQTGQVSASNFVYHRSLSDWTQAGSVDALAFAFGSNIERDCPFCRLALKFTVRSPASNIRRVTLTCLYCRSHLYIDLDVVSRTTEVAFQTERVRRMEGPGDWIVRRGAEQYPCPNLVTLAKWWRGKRILGADIVWNPHKAAWLRLGDIPALHELLNPATVLVNIVGTRSSFCVRCGVQIGDSILGRRKDGLCIICTIWVRDLLVTREHIVYGQSASYVGGIEGHPEEDWENGYILVTSSGVRFFNTGIEWHTAFNNVVSVERQKFESSGLRAGVSAVLSPFKDLREVQEVNAFLAISYISSDHETRTARFFIGGALTIAGCGRTAEVVMNHILEYKKLFRHEVTRHDTAPDDALDRIEKLASLREKGLLTPHEFETAKAALLKEVTG